MIKQHVVNYCLHSGDYTIVANYEDNTGRFYEGHGEYLVPVHTKYVMRDGDFSNHNFEVLMDMIIDGLIKYPQSKYILHGIKFMISHVYNYNGRSNRQWMRCNYIVNNIDAVILFFDKLKRKALECGVTINTYKITKLLDYDIVMHLYSQVRPSHLKSSSNFSSDLYNNVPLLKIE